MIFYQYPKKPQLVIKNGKLFTTQEECNKFSEGEIRQQASILLRILKGAGFATYNRLRISRKNFTPTKYRSYSAKYYHATHPKNKE